MKPINCDNIQSSLQDCIENDFPQLDTSHLLGHIQNCKQCRQAYDDYYRVFSRMKDVETPEPPLFSDPLFWEAFPEQVLAQVNEVKKSLSTLEQSANPNNVIAFNRHQKKEKTRRLTHLTDKFNRINLSVAASLFMVLGVLLFTQWESKNAPGYYQDIAVFQAKVNQSKPLPQLTNHIPRQFTPSGLYSFSPQPVKANSFFVGAYYAESVALLSDSDLQASSQHMSQLFLELKKVDISAAIHKNMTQVIDILSKPDASDDIRAETLATFEPTYVQFVDAIHRDELVFFRLGSWTVNMSLAALAKNRIVLDEISNVKYFTIELLRLSAPLGVITTLEDMQSILMHKTLSDKEYRRLFDLSMNLRVQLS